MKTILIAGVALIVCVQNVDAQNPIFGSAVVKPTTQTENKQIIGKGAAADYYGYYGNYYSYYANYYGSLGYAYRSPAYYSIAESYAYYAYSDYFYANYYQLRLL